VGIDPCNKGHGHLGRWQPQMPREMGFDISTFAFDFGKSRGVTNIFALLGCLFLHTPPTALIVDEVLRYIAVIEFLARRCFKVPEHVSLVSIDDNSD
jgi:DNA-binding LacI/PurR family transcriptional regulator